MNIRNVIIISCIFIFCSNVKCQEHLLYPHLQFFFNIKINKNSDTIYYVCIQNDSVNEIIRKYIKIESNKFIYIKDSLNFEIGRFKKVILPALYNLPKDIIFMRKVYLWKSCENGIIRNKWYWKIFW